MRGSYRFTDELLERVANRIVSALSEVGGATFAVARGSENAFGLVAVPYLEVRPGGLRLWVESEATARLTYAPKDRDWELVEEWWPSKRAEDELAVVSIALLSGRFTEIEGTVKVSGIRRPLVALAT